MLPYIIVAIVSGCFGFLMCALLNASRDADENAEDDIKKGNSID